MAEISASTLKSVVETVNGVGINPERVRVNMMMLPCLPINKCRMITLLNNGNIRVSDTETDVKGLEPGSLEGSPVVICQETGSMPVDYQQLLVALRALGEQVKIAGLLLDDRDEVRVKTQLYQIKDDGTRDVLFDRELTILSGSLPTKSTVENKSGHRHYPSHLDDFHREDLAHIGIRFSVKPQIIGEYIRLSGVVVMTKALGHDEVFKQRKASIYSYSTKKKVVPFSVVLPQGTDSVEFPLESVDGNIIICKLTAHIVGENGLIPEL